jgi:catabolite regulation protein CreA
VNIDTARKINGAACSVWFFQQGVLDLVPVELLALVNDSSVGQIQTAAEVIEADNAARMACPDGGTKRLAFVLNPAGAAAVKAFAASIPKPDPAT